MSVVAVTGNHPRHSYFVRQLAESGLLVGWVREVREEFVPVPPSGLAPRTQHLFKQHFARRREAEEEIFGVPDCSDMDVLEVRPDALNGDQVIDFINRRTPRLVLSYGCHKLSERMRSAIRASFWNTHGGLSPDYRGVITHFWPSYMLEPQMTGMTLHETTEALDGGAIIHQTGAEMVRGDGLHMLAARTVRKYADDLGALLRPALQAECLPSGVTQKSPGKLWLSSDWRPEHLHLIYEKYDDRIVDLAFNGEIIGRIPSLTSAIY